MTRWPRWAAALFAAAALQAQAGALAPRFCDRPAALGAGERDRLLRFAAQVRQVLEASGAPAALVARAGLDLRRFDIRYSHAGVALRRSPNTPWSVRQLYYACDEGRPRLYDQGLPGFVFGHDGPGPTRVALLLLPAEAAAALEQAALDAPRALRLLAATYSANAYPFSLRYQNCNQWVAELLATAWGGLADGDDLRARAQAWLAGAGYAPAPVAVRSHWWMAAGGFVPWIRMDDHPDEDRFALRFRLSLPASIEAFVQQRLPGTRRIELCLAGRQLVLREGWQPLDEACAPQPGDAVQDFDDPA